MLFYLKLYALTVPVFFLCDMVWLGIVAREFYRRNLEFLLRPQPNWAAAIGFYLLFVGGVLLFAVQPAIKEDSWARAALLGALFGLMTYATYDMTNLATVKDWPVLVSVVDILWGVVLCTTVSLTSFAFAKWLG